jgi:hypothetical protein
MKYNSLDQFLKEGMAVLAKGPISIVMAEDGIEVDTTLRHNIAAGFTQTLLFAHDGITIPAELEDQVHRIRHNVHEDAAMAAVVNRLIASAPGLWMYYCYNAEYLFYPFCETRNIREMLTFQTEERRDAVLSYVIDLYAKDLDRHPNAVSLEEAHLDKSGYYALGRPDPANHNHPKERQLDFFGGLRWRFEEHIPVPRRKIDRIAIFRAKPGLTLRPDFTFSDEEYNTYACPWHHNLTTAIVSFRTAKALRTNAGSMFDINSFAWHNSMPFNWHGQQLMDLGLMEPGQWF